MESYVDKPYPTKAGVYAVREGPFIAENIVHYINEEPLSEYVPQQGFLSLMMTGDGNCIGSKFGIGFAGNWVWKLKDYIDMGFMNLFNPLYLFKDYKKEGTKYPLDNFSLFDDDENEKIKANIEAHKKRAYAMTPEEAAAILQCTEDVEEF
jgi:selenide,water dikinase